MNSLQASLDVRVPKQKVRFALDIKYKLLQTLSFLPLPIQTVPVSDTDGRYPKCIRGSSNIS